MKKLLCAFLIVFVATTATAEIWRDDFTPTLVGSGEYDPETGLEIMNRTLPDWGTNGDGFISTLDGVTGEDTADLGWWWYDAMWRDTGLVFEADTVYELTVEARDGGDSVGVPTAGTNTAYGSLEIGFNRTDTWEHLNDYVNNADDSLYGYHTSQSFPITGEAGEGTAWSAFSVTFDTGLYPEVVGAPIGVELYGVNGNVVAAWTTFNNVSISVVPEPATMLLLGLGGLALRRKR